MKTGAKKHIKNVLVFVGFLSLSFGVSVLLQLLGAEKPITTVFVFGVFLISLMTDGYFYGIGAAFISVFAVNFAFTFPYFSFNFTIPENLISALVMIVISVMTSALMTRHKKLQSLRAKAEREVMRANLLRAVSHDLRTPLTTIYGSSSAILESGDAMTEEQKKKMIRGINQDSHWLIRMVENLLSVTRIDSGEIKLIKTPTVLYDLVDSVMLKFKKRYPLVNTEVEIPDDAIIIPMDAILIEQVILNLLENAVQHAKGMTKLSLTVGKSGKVIIFEIADNGCGIAENRLEKIFTGYYNEAEQPIDSQKRVAGIGLSVCATIIKAHGGIIKAENREGGGAIFRFELSGEEETCGGE